MANQKNIIPYSLKDAPALIEKLLPVQKLSAESYKEQMANIGKTLTALGSYWKGRKPLILNKACVLGCLLPATNNLKRDLEIFEKLMAMDLESFVVRLGRIKPERLVERIELSDIYRYFDVEPAGSLPKRAPFVLEDYRLENGKFPRINWRDDVSEVERRKVEALAHPRQTYREMVQNGDRPESCPDVHDHIWEEVNEHLGTDAKSFPELVEQLGIMRYGHRPRVADTFSGSGQISFEAARLGCDVYASDLNPVACMLTWGAFNIIGGSKEDRELLAAAQQELAEKLKIEIDRLGIETEEKGWRPRVYLYCMEVRCPQTGWMVPLLPTRILHKDKHEIVELIPNEKKKRYEIRVRAGVTKEELMDAEKGTVRSDGRGQDPYIVHIVNGTEYRTKISTIRGDYRKEDGSSGNQLRLWEKNDFKPRLDDIFQERLYAIQWVRPKKNGKGEELEFRTVTEDDEKREQIAEEFLSSHLTEWQEKGWIPDMRIESGEKTDEPIRTRGWTYWHHLFNPRQLILLGLVNRFSPAYLKPAFFQLVQHNSKLSLWDNSGGGRAAVKHVFYNQALNTLYNYGCRALSNSLPILLANYKSFPLINETRRVVESIPAEQITVENDIFITDPPYGDAVKYEEIMEFFIAWLRKNPPKEFLNWVWDSRRSLSIKGEDETFRRGMVAAYKRMAEKMPDNGIQVIMFTHQSGSIWADMANIVWASGLQVTAAWYVVTETDSPLRDGSYVKGTVLLVLRKRIGHNKTTRDDLAWEIQEEVEEQVKTLIGLNQETKDLYRDENLFEDADIQMAGYAAALRVLTRYAVIDGKDMTVEAIRPRVQGENTFVDELINFAVDVANQCLVPEGIAKATWDKLVPAERFYLKMADLEAKGMKTLDNYQNFAKAFKVKDFRPFMASNRANSARLKSAMEFGRTEMSEGSELYQTVLRGVLYAIMELVNDKDGDEVLTHLSFNVPNYYDQTQRDMIVELSDYLAKKIEPIRSDEARAARILRELIRNQRM
jgi:putative DNA methylase